MIPTPEEVAKLFNDAWERRDFKCELLIQGLKWPCECIEIAPGQGYLKIDFRVRTIGAPEKVVASS